MSTIPDISDLPAPHCVHPSNNTTLQVTSVDIPALATAEFARGDWLKVASHFALKILKV